MRFSGSIIGSKALAAALGRIQEDYQKQYVLNLKKATLVVYSEAVRSIRDTSQGEKETRYNPKRQVTVSKPGDAPNNDTGTALKSVGWDIDEAELVSEVGTGLGYLKDLEFGTKNVAARPWLFPALERVRQELVQIMKTAPPHKKAG